jgi:hypothetical protein
MHESSAGTVKFFGDALTQGRFSFAEARPKRPIQRGIIFSLTFDLPCLFIKVTRGKILMSNDKKNVSAKEIHDFWSSKEIFAKVKAKYAKSPVQIERAQLLHKVAKETDAKTFMEFMQGKLEDFVVKLTNQEMMLVKGGKTNWKETAMEKGTVEKGTTMEKSLVEKGATMEKLGTIPEHIG